MAGKSLADTLGVPELDPTPAPAAAPAGRNRDGLDVYRVILQEAGNDPEGMRAVASVIRNRAPHGLMADVPEDVVFAPGQFGPGMPKDSLEYRGWQKASRTPADDPRLRAVIQATQGIVTGRVPTPYPYTQYYSPKAQAGAGRDAPAWDDGTGVNIGGNLFFERGGTPDLARTLGVDEDLSTASQEVRLTPTHDQPNPGPVADPQAKTVRFLAAHGFQNPNAPKGSSQNPYGITKEGNYPTEPGVWYVDRDGQLRQSNTSGDFLPYYQALAARQAVEKGQPLPNRLMTGAGQGVLDVGESANKLLGGGLSAPAATLGMGGMMPALADLHAQEVGAPSQRDYADFGLDAARQQRNEFDLLHQGDPVVGSARFAAQAVPAAGLAAAVPEISLPGAAAAGAVDAGLGANALRIAGQGITNAGRGAAATLPVVSTSDAPVGNQLIGGAVTGAVLPPALSAAGRVATGAGAAVRNLVEPLTEGGREAIAGRMLRARAQGGNLLNPDLTEYIAGSRPTLAEALGNPGLATAQRAIGTNDLRFSNLFRANADAREAAVAALKGDPAAREALVAARDNATQEELASVFDNARPTDPTPVIQHIDEILAGRAGQRDAVAGPLRDIRAKLVKPDGTLQTDPELLWGIRQHIGDILSPLARGTAQDGRAAARELMGVREQLDPVISQGAPGFMAWPRRYANLSRPIDEFDFLQSLNLTTPRGQVTEGQIGSALKRIEAMRRAGGTNGAKSLSDDTLLGLRSLQADLQRQSNSELGRGTGSDTTQKMVERMASGADAVHPLIDLAAGHAGPLGPLGVRAARGFYMGQRQRILDNYANLLLDPAAGLPALDEPVGNPLSNAWSRAYRASEPLRIPVGALVTNNQLTSGGQ